MNIVTIIILTHNSEKYIENCLDSLSRQTHKDFRVIILDNNSTDQTLHRLSQYPIEIIQSKENLGWATGNNHILRMVESKFAILLNIDTILDENWLKELVDSASNNPSVACISSSILDIKDFPSKKNGFALFFNILDGLIYAYASQDIEEVTFVPGTSLLINLTLINKPKFLDSFFMYHEDVEFSLRTILQYKYKLLFNPRSIVWHDNEQSFNNTDTCKLALRNWFYCLSRYQSKRSFLINSPSYFKSYLKLRKFYRRHFGNYYDYCFLKNFLSTIISVKANRPEYKSTCLAKLKLLNDKGSRVAEFKFIF